MTAPVSGRPCSTKIAFVLMSCLLALPARPAAAWGSKTPPAGMKLQWKIRLSLKCQAGQGTPLPPEKFDDMIAVGPIVNEGPEDDLVNFLGRSNERYSDRPGRLRLDGNRVFLREGPGKPEVLFGTFSQKALDDACSGSEAGSYASGEFDITLDPSVKLTLSRSGGSSFCTEKFAVGTTSRDFQYDCVFKDASGHEVHLKADQEVIFRKKQDCQSWKDKWVDGSGRTEGPAGFGGIEN